MYVYMSEMRANNPQILLWDDLAGDTSVFKWVILSSRRYDYKLLLKSKKKEKYIMFILL